MSEILLDITLSERGTYCNFCFASFPKTMLAISIAHGFIAFSAMVWVFLFLAISYATLAVGEAYLQIQISSFEEFHLN